MTHIRKLRAALEAIQDQAESHDNTVVEFRDAVRSALTDLCVEVTKLEKVHRELALYEGDEISEDAASELEDITFALSQGTEAIQDALQAFERETEEAVPA